PRSRRDGARSGRGWPAVEHQEYAGRDHRADPPRGDHGWARCGENALEFNWGRCSQPRVRWRGIPGYRLSPRYHHGVGSPDGKRFAFSYAFGGPVAKQVPRTRVPRHRDRHEGNLDPGTPEYAVARRCRNWRGATPVKRTKARVK